MDPLIPRPQHPTTILSRLSNLATEGKKTVLVATQKLTQTFFGERVTAQFSERHQAIIIRRETLFVQREITRTVIITSDSPSTSRAPPPEPEPSSQTSAQRPSQDLRPPSGEPQQVAQQQGTGNPPEEIPLSLLPNLSPLPGKVVIPQTPQTSPPEPLKQTPAKGAESASLLSPSSLHTLVLQVKQCERALASPDFSTQAKLILEGGHPLYPQTTQILKELSQLNSILKQLEQEKPSGFATLAPALGKELRELETHTLQTLIPRHFSSDPQGKFPSFLTCQERLLTSAQLQPRLTELRKQLEPFMGRLPNEIAEKVATQSKILNEPHLNPAKPPPENKLVPRILPYPASLQFAARINSRADLVPAIQKIGEVRKKEGHNPLIIVPYPFEKKAEDVKNFKGKNTPSKKEALQLGDEEGGGAAQPMVYIPEGTVLLGDPFKEGAPEELPLKKLAVKAFLIGAVPITVTQYTSWLNSKMKINQLIVKAGVIYDLEKKPLAKTKESSLTSSLETVVRREHLLFSPLPGSEELPITEISWYGARTFCEEYGVRLPSEAEWERAASMEEEKKYRYGFSLDLIDPSLANYQQDRPTPVGFYNGESHSIQDGKELLTKDAVSPWGCYDMSGNVREWTTTSQKHRKITKGGSYLSPAFELRVSARLSFDPEEMLPDTGFRTVLDA